VPVPRDSGRRTGNLHRPKRYSRRLRRVFYMSAHTSIIREGPNQDFNLKKRGEGCKHVQADIALAWRRASVLWALLSDGRTFASAHRSPRRLDFVIETPSEPPAAARGGRSSRGSGVGKGDSPSGPERRTPTAQVGQPVQGRALNCQSSQVGWDA